ncbi:MAG: hypothetical protein ACR2KS_09905 [Candidatus Eremiobacter antarcticus]|nr:hypothetical protein [Candidatus Eremiobacteraeota bacterium]MBC5807011.1 hypothetical protein [Candidatus Eremiobacteraeota bacterium]
MPTHLLLLVRRFNEAAGLYSLARLELAMRNPQAPLAPLLPRLGTRGLNAASRPLAWTDAGKRVLAIHRYRRNAQTGRVQIARDAAWLSFQRTVDSLMQITRSIETLRRRRGEKSR